MSPGPRIIPKVGEEGSYNAAVYGSILVAALVGSLSAEHASPSTMTLTVAATMAVFWLAHVWAAIVGAHIGVGASFSRARVLELCREEWPMVEAGFVPVLALALAWVGIFSSSTGADLALGLAVVQLIGWGIAVGRRAYTRWLPALVAGLVYGLLGLFIVALEVALH